MSIGFARIKHDNPPRNNPLRVYPETVPMNNAPKDGKGEVIPYVGEWETWTRELNEPASADWLFAFHSMLFNIESTNPYKAESITNGGNVVRVVAETERHARIAHFRNDQAPPEAVDYINRPYMVQKVVCLDSETMQLRKPADGKDVYFPLLSRNGSNLWIAKERLEFFPLLPCRVNVAVERLAVYRNPQPSAKIVEHFPYARSLTVLEYRPRGSQVWGQIGYNRWILLQGEHIFTTTWVMQTQPPIP